jgi:excisionase family DNA binding protein
VEKELLAAEDVAGILGVGTATVWRWCREGSLPCVKIGKSWRIRREALSRFLERGERPATLTGQLRSFIEVTDSLLAIAQDHKLLHRLDAAFLRVGDERGGTLVKYLGGEPETSTSKLRTDLERNGLDVARLEEEGRLRFVGAPDPSGGLAGELRRLLASLAHSGRTIWPASTGQRRSTSTRRSNSRKRRGRQPRRDI